MDDTTFRTKAEPEEKKEPVHEAAEETTQEFIKEEVPYSEYPTQVGKPYLVEHYELGDRWEVFAEEINTLDHYFKRKIEEGDVAPSVEAVKKELKKMEKLNNVKDEERTVMRLGTLAAYIRFLNETEGIKFNWRKYGTH